MDKAETGMPPKIVILFKRDDSDGVFVGTSPDVPGLVVEERTFEELRAAVEALAPVLMSDEGTASPVEITFLAADS